MQPLTHRPTDGPPFALPEPAAFGRSLHIDFYGVSRTLRDDLGFCYQLLDDLTARLGMHKQAPPFLFRLPDAEFPDKAGLSGWVPLIESGISIHTLTLTGFVSIDLYTCGALDVDDAARFLAERLGSTDFAQSYLVRGRRYHA